MVGLIDIAPKIETVDVQGASVSVHGISAKGVAHLLGRFPELRMTGQDVETGQLMAMGLQAKCSMAAYKPRGSGRPCLRPGRKADVFFGWPAQVARFRFQPAVFSECRE